MAESMQELKGPLIEELLDSTDCWIFDCDGVLWLGNHTIPGVADVLDKLRSLGKKTVFVTNNSTKSRAMNAKKFQETHGINVQPDEVVGSAYNAAYYIKHVMKLPEDKKVFVVGDKGLEDELNDMGVKFVGGHQEPNKPFSVQEIESYVPDPDVQAVLWALDLEVSYTKMTKAMQYLARGDAFLATNDDLTFPLQTKKAIGTGALLKALQYASGRQAKVLGKPHPQMIEVVLSRFNLDASRCVMVGDRLNTDIAFGRNGGMKTLLVLTGISQLKDVRDPSNTIVPDYYINSLGDLKDHIR